MFIHQLPIQDFLTEGEGVFTKDDHLTWEVVFHDPYSQRCHRSVLFLICKKKKKNWGILRVFPEWATTPGSETKTYYMERFLPKTA